jgi:phosphatidylinositol kinase/protein kinase (PI-3  family)
VPNLITFKEVVRNQYVKSKTDSIFCNKNLHTLLLKHNASENKIENFRSLKEQFPPVLGQWFLQHFSSPQCYFRARQNYIKSVAVVSMIGYIMGLGDRHLENILFDTFSGEVVHVDFNCLYHKGESLT